MEPKSELVESKIVVSTNVAPGYEKLDKMLEGCQVIGYDWRYLYVNDTVVKQGKKTRRALLGKTMMEAYPGIEKTNLFSQLQQCMNERVPVRMENEFTFPNGEKGWFDLSIQPVPEGIFILSNDITERRIYELECETTIEFLHIANRCNSTVDLVKASATFFQQKSGCDAVGIRLKEGDDYPYYEYRGFSKVFVSTENNLCARDAAGDVVRDCTGEAVLECMCGNVIRGRFDSSKPFFTKGGSFWTNSTSQLLASTTEADRQARTRNRCNGEGYESVALLPLRMGTERVGLLQLNGRQKGMFSARSIALWERLAGHLSLALSKTFAEEALHKYANRLEELVNEKTAALRESERKYSVIVEEASDGVIILQDGKIVFANKKAEEMVGYSIEEVAGYNFTMLLSEQHRQLAMQRYERRLRGENVPSVYETELIAKNGTPVPVELNATGIQYLGHPADLVILRDITERKLLEEKRSKLEKLASIGETAAMVGHDLRNPLQAIKNATYVLKHAMPQGSNAWSVPAMENAEKMLGVIDNAVTYADNIVLDLRDFSVDRKPMRRKADINALVDETLLSMQIPDGVAVNKQFSQVPSLSVDADQLRRMFQNIVENAVQAMADEGTLTVTTKESGGFVEVAFNDTGAGISKETMGKLFTPFYTTKAQGMGLGLAICKNFAEAHGGTITVESQEGAGSTFTVRLPVKNGEVKP